jgi:putative cardiolipin synthase
MSTALTGVRTGGARPAGPLARVVATGLRAAAGALLLALAAGCASLPKEVDRTPSAALTDTGDTRIGRVVAPLAAAHPDLTGIHALAGAGDAFAVRVLLARAADRSIDVQYYIWHDDLAGKILFKELEDAANRGVRVRLLLDDQNTKGLDHTLAMLDAHPNIEVRLFNPYASRGLRVGDYTTDFSRVNRRMHNKSFTVDNQVSIVGGRNIGDEYFGAGDSVTFADLDVIAAGGAVPSISSEFDDYWNSPSAYPTASLLAPVTPDEAAAVRAGWAAALADEHALGWLRTVGTTPLVTSLLDGTMPFEWDTARMIADDPSKVLNPPDRKDLQLLPRLVAMMGNPDHELDIVSAYFVPTKDGTQAIRALADRGIQVRVLTNSLAATDVPPVYAGYAKYREDLLKGGNLRLFELKRARPPEGGKSKQEQKEDKPGGSSASLHAKTIATDRRRIFVGSFNLDPRSESLNTEMGLVIDSANLAGRLADAFDHWIPANTYEVVLPEGATSVQWLDRAAGDDVRLDKSPDTSAWDRFLAGFLSILPIEWLL